MTGNRLIWVIDLKSRRGSLIPCENKGERLKLIVIDGGKGLLAALPLVYGHVPIQRCWTHKTRNVLNYVKRADQQKVKRSLHRISHAHNLREAQKAAQRFVAR